MAEAEKAQGPVNAPAGPWHDRLLFRQAVGAEAPSKTRKVPRPGAEHALGRLRAKKKASCEPRVAASRPAALPSVPSRISAGPTSAAEKERVLRSDSATARESPPARQSPSAILGVTTSAVKVRRNRIQNIVRTIPASARVSLTLRFTSNSQTDSQ